MTHIHFHVNGVLRLTCRIEAVTVSLNEAIEAIQAEKQDCFHSQGICLCVPESGGGFDLTVT